MLKYHIQTIEVGAAGAAEITFNNIPQDYDDLYLVSSVRTNRAAPDEVMDLVFNGADTNRTSRNLRAEVPNVASSSLTNLGDGWATAANVTANTFGSIFYHIPNYRSNAAKSYSIDSVTENNATYAVLALIAGLWSSTAAVNSLTIKSENNSTLVQYSSASLYGIKRGSDGKTEVASGGTITTSGGYTIHTFQSSGTFVANRDLDVEYLVVGGGGGGGGNNNSDWSAGGGGAGGYRSSVTGESSGGGAPAEPKVRVTSGESFAVIVGSGGSAGSATRGGSGNASVFGNIQSFGGGGGGSSLLSAGAGGSGGSGGGGGGTSGAAGIGTANQGYNGGTATQAGAGGGGAGQVGESSSSNTPGDGGNGVTSSITGTSITRGGGGGAGETFDSPTNGLGGTGGGGDGGVYPGGSGEAGEVNTGGGGGGARLVGGAGGSGVVIIRYPTPA